MLEWFVPREIRRCEMTQQLDPQTVKQQQREQWSQAAPAWKKYDDRLRETAAPVTLRLLALAGVEKGHRVLDIASGTGEPSIPAAETVGPEGYVLATDISEEMLDVARGKAKGKGLSNIEFRRVDGEELGVEDGSFDAVLCRWGIMFMPEPERCLRQAAAALKPGGRAAFAVWGPPPRNPFFTVPIQVLTKYTEMPPPQPGAPGPFAFADSGRLESVFAQAGFKDVQLHDMELPMAVFDTGREYWEYVREMAAPLQAALQQIPAEKHQEIADEIASAAGGGNPDGPTSLNGYTVLAVGRK
jgi:ubiquinone/menaquinone biosynthesis C-methylase UbiE